MALSFPVSAPGLQGPPLGLQEIGEVILGQAETSASLATPAPPSNQHVPPLRKDTAHPPTKQILIKVPETSHRA